MRWVEFSIAALFLPWLFSVFNIHSVCGDWGLWIAVSRRSAREDSGGSPWLPCLWLSLPSPSGLAVCCGSEPRCCGEDRWWDLGSEEDQPRCEPTVSLGFGSDPLVKYRHLQITSKCTTHSKVSTDLVTLFGGFLPKAGIHIQMQLHGNCWFSCPSSPQAGHLSAGQPVPDRGLQGPGGWGGETPQRAVRLWEHRPRGYAPEGEEMGNRLQTQINK